MSFKDLEGLTNIKLTALLTFNGNLVKKIKVLLTILEKLFKIRNSLINEKIKLYIKKRWKDNERNFFRDC
jgi:hypothetical protein